MDGLLERLGAGGGRVFSVAPAPSPDGPAAQDSSGGRLLEHLGWPCSLRTALLVSMSVVSSNVAVPRCRGVDVSFSRS